VSILDEILDHKRQEVAERRAVVPRPPARSSPARDFAAALHGEGVVIIAEFKRASPSRGAISTRWTPPQLAAIYESAGAAALSVLTDERYFGGSLDDLREARAACSLPVLRKDFVIDEWQLEETAAAGADAVLLIVAALGNKLDHMLRTARDLGLAALVEAHDREEVRRAVDAGAGIVGINNRDLRTFQVRIETTRELRPRIPADRTVVSESGITAPDHVRALAAMGVNAALVGEALMVADDPALLLNDLVVAGAMACRSPARNPRRERKT